MVFVFDRSVACDFLFYSEMVEHLRTLDPKTLLDMSVSVPTEKGYSQDMAFSPVGKNFWVHNLIGFSHILVQKMIGSVSL